MRRKPKPWSKLKSIFLLLVSTVVYVKPNLRKAFASVSIRSSHTSKLEETTILTDTNSKEETEPRMMEATTQAVNRSSARDRTSYDGWPSVPSTTASVINIQMGGFQGCFN